MAIVMFLNINQTKNTKTKKIKTRKFVNKWQRKAFIKIRHSIHFNVSHLYFSVSRFVLFCIHAETAAAQMSLNNKTTATAKKTLT